MNLIEFLSSKKLVKHKQWIDIHVLKHFILTLLHFFQTLICEIQVSQGINFQNRVDKKL